MDVDVWTFIDTTLGIGHTFYSTILSKNDKFYILFAYQNRLEVIYVDLIRRIVKIDVLW